MAKEYKGRVVFLKVDVNRNYETSSAAGIRAMPTFTFFYMGKKREEFSGADSRRLRSTCDSLAGQAKHRGTYVGKEVTATALAAFYEKHGLDADKVPSLLARAVAWCRRPSDVPSQVSPCR
jgi:thioredoxin-like negative regulator of GroEL